jgi:hypothetical protein
MFDVDFQPIKLAKRLYVLNVALCPCTRTATTHDFVKVDGFLNAYRGTQLACELTLHGNHIRYGSDPAPRTWFGTEVDLDDCAGHCTAQKLPRRPASRPQGDVK